jgi:DNA gyrase/topoisomerase IV subunit A
MARSRRLSTSSIAPRLATHRRTGNALPIDDSHRRERTATLAAIETALADPARLIGVLLDAADDDDALARLMSAYGVNPEQAQALLDLQVRRVIPVHRARVAEELRVLRAESDARESEG